MELVLTALILSFILAATAQLYRVGNEQHRIVRHYSQVQVNLREALRRATRTIRHGSAVVTGSTVSNFQVADSTATQLIVVVPEPTGVMPDWIQVRIHLDGGILYAQRADQAAPGTPLITGVQSVNFDYFQVAGTTRAAVNGTPQVANEVQLSVVGRDGNATTRVTTLVNLRNAIAGSL